MLRVSLLFVVLTIVSTSTADAQWSRFRGPDGMGISDETNLPITWSDSENLQWKAELPGAGSSSPVLTDRHVFVTCYSGYGTGNVGSPENMRRHLLCLDRKSGETVWSADVAAELPEDSYQGYITEHGYASSTPIIDGERVYVFFGKTGVFAYDLQGNQLWHVDVGKESSNRRWGSGASLVLYKDTVIVNASEESQSIRALDRQTGQQRWKAEAASLELSYGTPALVSLDDGRTDLVIGVPGEIWALNPDTGKLAWYATTTLTGNICPSPIFDGDLVYLFGGYRSYGSLAIRAGGSGDVTDTHVQWTSETSSYVATPLLHGGRLYWADDRGQAHCMDAKTGEDIYRERLPDQQGGGRPVYASPVLANGNLYVVSRRSGTYILPAEPEFRIVAHNQLDDDSDFNGTPAIDNGQIFLRSNRCLYCVSGE